MRHEPNQIYRVFILPGGRNKLFRILSSTSSLGYHTCIYIYINRLDIETVSTSDTVLGLFLEKCILEGKYNKFHKSIGR